METLENQDRFPPWTSSLSPAPGDLRIVQAFVNTWDIESGSEEIVNAGALSTWLTRWGLLAAGESISPEDLRRAIDAREALRALLLANNGSPQDASAVERLARLGSETRLRVGFTAEGAARFEPTGKGWSRALAGLLEIVAIAEIQGNWRRLKACQNDGCHWVFYDFSKNRSGKWCTMRRCGNQANARAYRRRKSLRGRGEPAEDSSLASSQQR